MAEPTGILLKVQLEEKEVKKLLIQKYNDIPFGKKLGYYFSKLLYDTTIDAPNVFLFNYDKKTNTLFIAWMLNHFEPKLLEPFQEILSKISTLKISTTTNYAIITSTYPEVLKAYQITTNNIKVKNPSSIPIEEIETLTNLFWSFSENNQFPEPNIALNKRNYFYKGFKNYYKKYLAYIEEQEKPKKIALATVDAPYHLFDKFYTYNNKVFEFRTFTNQVIEILGADPLTFRNVSGIYADKNHVFIARLTSNSPPNTNPKTGRGNNPNAIWEYYIVEGVDGASFTYVKEKWDTIYWKDNKMVYTYNRDKRILAPLTGVDLKTFEYINFTYGKDKNKIYCYENALEIDPKNYLLDKYGFIKDNDNIYHFENKIQLDAHSFKVLKTEKTKQFAFPNYILEDKNGTYTYNRKYNTLR